MKALVWLFFMIPVFSLGQEIQVDFETGDLSHWYSPCIDHWGIDEGSMLTGERSLRHRFDSDEGGVDWIVLPHDPVQLSASGIEWQFSFRYLYAPSANNNWAILLGNEDFPDGGGRIKNGFIIGVNYEGNSDEIKIWQASEGEIKEVLNTGINWENDEARGVPVDFVFILSDHRKALLQVRLPDREWDKFEIDGISDYRQFSLFTLYHKYTGSYDQGLWFDELKIFGECKPDRVPPSLEGLDILDANRIELFFDEPVRIEEGSEWCIAEMDCRTLSASVGSRLSIGLPFLLAPGREYTIQLGPFADLHSNTAPQGQRGLNFYYPAANDVIITEIMADPSPSVLLPEVEYVEVFNRSGSDLWVRDWTFSANGRTTCLAAVKIPLDGRMILTESEAVLGQYGTVWSSEAFPALKNTGAQLFLRDAGGRLIHAVAYEEDWHSTADKHAGGYALEMKNTNEPCLGGVNWGSSEGYSGGTPGEINSVDEQADCFIMPELWRVGIIDSFTLLLEFSEPMDSSSLTSPLYYAVDHGMGSPANLQLSWPFANRVYLKYSQPFRKNILYKLRLTNDLCDCSGNLLSNSDAVFSFPGTADSADIILNEILYEPDEGYEEYIELYNRSDHTIDLEGFRISMELKSGHDGVITDKSWQLGPHEYAVLARSYSGIDDLQVFPEAAKVICMPQMPGLPNRSTLLYLYRDSVSISDIAWYSPEQHHALLADTKGVALERASQSLPGTLPSNWQSAAFDAGYKSPGRKNSQEITTNQTATIHLNNKSLIPGSGRELILEYVLEEEGSMGQVFIYDTRGFLRRVLGNGVILGTAGNFTFDGTDDAGYPLAEGPYILYFNAYHQQGGWFRDKILFVLGK
ncbi:MAG: lamin tail domain-containing protein [Bacteroidales bacterium]|nr:lamin tail domain-containing protein [Bacteroidales bacterium]